MVLSNVVESLWTELEISPDTFNDERSRVYLISKKSEDDLEVLITPFGENAKKEENLAYAKISQEKIFVFHWDEAKVLEHKLKDNTKYMTIENPKEKIVIPYRARNFPQRIMPNYFTNIMQESRDKLGKGIVICLEELEKKQKGEKISLYDSDYLAKLMGETIPVINNISFSNISQPIIDAFKEEENPSKKLHRYKRYFKHFFLKDVNHFLFLENSKIKNIKEVFNSAGTHFLASTKDHKNILTEEENKTMGEMKTVFPQTQFFHDLFVQRKKSHQIIGATNYIALLSIGCVLSKLISDDISSALLYMAGAETLTSLINYKLKGHPTSIFGTLQDLISK